MINNISESPMRTVMKTDPIGPIHDQEMNRQKTDALRETRPVEQTTKADESGTRKSEDDASSKYLMEGKTVVFEKYNKSGEVIYRLPPSATPIDERA